MFIACVTPGCSLRKCTILSLVRTGIFKNFLNIITPETFIRPRVEWWDHWSLMNGKGFERNWSCPNKGIIRVFSMNERTTVNLPAEVLTEHPSNTTYESIDLQLHLPA